MPTPSGVQSSWASPRFYKLLGGAALWIGSEVNKAHLGPSKCRVCEPPSADWAIRNHWKWSSTKSADSLSNALAFAIIPFGSLAALAEYSNDNKHVDAMIIVAEAVIYSSLLNQFTKFSIGRERPFVHALPNSEKNKVDHADDNNLSFYSGHTNLVFAASVATHKLLKHFNSPSYIGPTLIGLAGATGYLRIAADKHYASDVLVGATMGTLFAYHFTQIAQSQSLLLPTPSGLIWAFQY
jgi:membrane-associated phospholipid phosphatase